MQYLIEKIENAIKNGTKIKMNVSIYDGTSFYYVFVPDSYEYEGNSIIINHEDMYHIIVDKNIKEFSDGSILCRNDCCVTLIEF